MKLIICQNKTCEPTTFGENCEFNCSSNCLNSLCQQDTGFCINCKDENTWGNLCTETCNNCEGGCNQKDGTCSKDCINKELYGPDCETPCNKGRDHCKKCNKDGNCFECDNNYWNVNCSKSCSHCKDGCDQENGRCLNDGSCEEDEYYGPDCETPCNKDRDHCQKCSKDGNCFECDNYFWNVNCSKQCSHCKDGCHVENGTCLNDGSCEEDEYYGPDCETPCNKDREHCQKCSKDGNCLVCDNNYWNVNCSKQCSHCKDGCYVENGTCINDGNCLNDEFYGDDCEIPCNKGREHCDKCNRNGDCIACTNNNFWNLNCSEPCSKCEDGCYIGNGTCIGDGNCVNDTFYGDDCKTPCNEGREHCDKCNRNGDCIVCTNNNFWNLNCSEACSKCKDGCYIENGTCIGDGNCVDDTFYGDDCKTPCNEGREHCDKCNRNGDCIACTNNNFWNLNCSEPCSKCEDGCYIENGTCIGDGNCVNDTFYGDDCKTPCNEGREHCDKCNRNGDCIVCTNNNFWNLNCSEPCSKCKDGCYIENGTCIGNENCVNDTFYGDNCEIPCNEGRENCDKCNRNGDCIVCTNNNFWNLNCSEPCSKCKDGCYIENGTCIGDGNCVNDTFYGDNCEIPCNEGREHCDKCNRNGDCIVCTDNNFWNLNCSEPCSKCQDGCYIDNGTCIGDGNCVNDTFYGDSCEIPCNEGREHCDKCNRNGDCIVCTNNNFWNLNCSEPCSKCKDGCYIGNGTCIGDGNCVNDTFYGHDCETPCNEGREYCDKCNRNGDCIVCTDNNFWNLNCSKACSHCENGCYIGNGTCIGDGNCVNNEFYGHDCEIPCNKGREHCENCNRNGSCIYCTNNRYYDLNCSQGCPYCPDGCHLNGSCTGDYVNCSNIKYHGDTCNDLCIEQHEYRTCTTCYKNGTCTSCKENQSYGNDCSNSCENCTKGECDMNGICLNKTHCREVYFFNLDCNGNCQKNCSKEGCYMNGTCIKACSKDHYNFPYCNLTCNSNCKDNYCDDLTGFCSECTDKKFLGGFCDEPISNRSDLKNCNESNQLGTSCPSCANGTYYGNKCELPCSEGCLDTYIPTKKKMCKNTGICEGCTDKYFGIYCNQTCDGCGEIGCDDQGYCKKFKCIDGKYGLKCDGNCTCENNSNSIECGKFSGECSTCNYGYFGPKCQKQCHYKCKTGLCCIFKDKKLEPNDEIKTNYKYLNISLNNKTYTVEIDYNYGYPLTLFNTTDNCSNNINNVFINYTENIGEIGAYTNIHFTNYDIKGFLFKNATFDILKGDKKKKENTTLKQIDVVIADVVSCKNSSNSYKGANGVIGLGFFNTISNSLFLEKPNGQNILTYSVDYKKDTVKLIFGSISSKQYDYIEKLTSCDVIFKDDTDIQGKKMTCKLDGIKSSQHSSGLRLNNASITFSIGESSSLILSDNEFNKKFIEKVYFIDKPTKKEDNITGNTYFLYPKKKINKLHNFGFVFNDFYYSYEPNLFFSEETYPGGKKRFLVELTNKTNTSEFILGREFLKDITFTINNEEAEIYFYAKNAEYSDKLKTKPSSSNFRTTLETREVAAILLAIIVFINIVAFVIYYFIKKKKMNSDDYIKID